MADIKEVLKNTVVKKAIYSSLYGVADYNGRLIPKLGEEFQPTCEEHIMLLDEQVARGFATKS